MKIQGEGTLYYGSEKEPELRYLADGTPMIRFSIAWYQGKEKDQGFISAVAFREIAERIAESVRHGDRVVITGALDHWKGENREGEKTERFTVTVYDIGISLRFDSARSLKPEASGPRTAPAANLDPDEAPF